jgi:hypothetical protein
VVAAAEAAVGLAIILTVFKNRNTLNIDDLRTMRDEYRPAKQEEAEKAAPVSVP